MVIYWLISSKKYINRGRNLNRYADIDKSVSIIVLSLCFTSVRERRAHTVVESVL
jgi:hypothetical protein